ncbi:hypothetical protein [Cytobacillus massiliigabonensis]|uniref:hypothetical protein n=1 Tax=Cytobacillus massiliigabonensis TaxID=1871011 RepID=UPI0015E07234|nr:hypothetical protein [Cytobacillus massiliigabonensis]
MLTFLCIIAGAIIGFILYEFPGILLGAIFGILAVITHQLDLIIHHLKKQNTSHNDPK